MAPNPCNSFSVKWFTHHPNDFADLSRCEVTAALAQQVLQLRRSSCVSTAPVVSPRSNNAALQTASCPSSTFPRSSSCRIGYLLPVVFAQKGQALLLESTLLLSQKPQFFSFLTHAFYGGGDFLCFFFFFLLDLFLPKKNTAASAAPRPPARARPSCPLASVL